MAGFLGGAGTTRVIISVIICYQALMQNAVQASVIGLADKRSSCCFCLAVVPIKSGVFLTHQRPSADELQAALTPLSPLF